MTVPIGRYSNNSKVDLREVGASGLRCLAVGAPSAAAIDQSRELSGGPALGSSRCTCNCEAPAHSLYQSTGLGKAPKLNTTLHKKYVTLRN